MTEGKGLQASTSPWIAILGAPVAAFVIWWFEIREPQPEVAAPPLPAPQAAPEQPREERYEYIGIYELNTALNALDFERHDGRRLYFSGVVRKVNHELSTCGSLLVMPAGEPMKQVRCDMACPVGSKGFGAGASVMLEGIVHAGPLGAWVTGCRLRR